MLPSEQIGSFINQLSRETLKPSPPVPHDLDIEARAASAAMSERPEISRIAEASHLTCPECQGPLWVTHEAPEHFRCDVGHAFGINELEQSQARALERALWVAYRILVERARLLEQMASSARARGMANVADDYSKRMHELRAHSREVIATLGAIEPPSHPAEHLEERL